MLSRAVAAVWNEPPPTPAPRGLADVPWWDRALAAVVLALGIWDTLRLETTPWRPVALGLALTLPCCLALRRIRPLLAFLVGFGPRLLVDMITFAAGAPLKDSPSGAFVLLLAYSLFRWGAGRDAIIGLSVMALVYATTVVTGEVKTTAEAIAAVLFLLFGPTLGAAFRFRASAQQRALDQARLLERERLARELHDTVAHHASAIVIQAQAGRALATSQPGAAVQALEVIEEAASQALSELRTIVSALRDANDAELAPQRGVGDLDELAAGTGTQLTVHVSRRGELQNLRPSVDAALYRVAQESVTNAIRHAAGASRVDIEVTGEPDCVRLVVADDGRASPDEGEASGYGLAGMQERASLLGGTFSAGPGAMRGFRVEVVLPRKGEAR